MQLGKRTLGAVLSVTLLIAVVMPLITLRAQDSAVTLTLVVPGFSRQNYSDKMMGEFEAQHPGVKVNIISDSAGIPSAAAGVDKHLEEVQKYVNTADVLYADSNRLSVEATRAGYYLDLAPLVNDDKKLNPSDFYPALWTAYQWDKGVWALPYAADPLILVYDPVAFDKAGLAYPSEGWTLADFDNAIRKLAVKDPDGKVTQTGIDVFTGYTDVVLFRSLLGDGLFDANTIPNPPQLNKPGVEAMLDTWVKLDQEGLIGHEFNKSPLGILPAFAVIVPTGTDQKRVGILLPGGKAGLDAGAFAVSAGTQHPDLAYALVSFLTTRAELALTSGSNPARRSLADAKPNDTNIGINIPPDVKKLMGRALENGFSVSDLRYAGYLALTIQKMKDQKLDAKSALDLAEVEAVKNQQAAADKKNKAVLSVATPVPATDLKGGKIALKFGLVVYASPLPQQDKWDKLIADFSAADPQVGRVELNSGMAQLDKLSEQNDCFYLPYNAVPNTNPNQLLNLDPFLTADTAFDKNDVMGGVMPQLQRDNKTWALPIDIEPSILKYDSEKFSKSGAVAPTNGWTTDAFKDALKTLKIDPKDPAPFEAPNAGGVHLLMFMAAYGGLPIDYRTEPPVINFTDPATVDAIRQVLDLAKQGYIKYDALGNIMNMMGGGGGQLTVPIYNDSLNMFSFFQNQDTTKVSPYKSTTYPRGTKYSAASYTIGTAYISAKSRNPEACYRWIRAVAQHTELFSAMPAYRSMLKDPTFIQTQGADLIALYSLIDQQLQDPNTLSLPSQFGASSSPTGFLIQHWLYQAFDNYVLNGKDLEPALKDAETLSKGFQSCTVNLPPLDMTDQQKSKDYIKQFGDCAVKVDPSLKVLFDLIPQ